MQQMCVSWRETKQWLVPHSPRDLSFPCRLSSLKYHYAIILNIKLISTMLCEFRNDIKLKGKAPSKTLFVQTRIVFGDYCRPRLQGPDGGWLGLKTQYLREYQCHSNDRRSRLLVAPRIQYFLGQAALTFNTSIPNLPRRYQSLHATQGHLSNVIVNFTSRVGWAKLFAKALKQSLYLHSITSKFRSEQPHFNN